MVSQLSLRGVRKERGREAVSKRRRKEEEGKESKGERRRKEGDDVKV